MHVAIATPMLDGTCVQAYAFSLAQTLGALESKGVTVSLLATRGVAVAQARNRLVATSLANPEMTHLLFIDSDHGWSPTDVFRLIAMDKSVIGIVARKKKANYELAANVIEGPVTIDKKGSMLVDAVGTGFIMIKREALDAMKRHYPQLKMEHPDPNATQEERDNYYRLFEFTVNEKGQEVSEDLAFCARWRDKGGDIWCDPEAIISHIGIKDYRGGIGELLHSEDVA